MARPLATYRLQFSADMTFRDARRLVPYLRSLGVSHIYASPYVTSRPGSTHGYDVTNPNALNPEIGSEREYNEFVQELRDHGMSQVLDWVPNHMGVGFGNNVWWQDVMEKGRESIYADVFDIDWRPAEGSSQVILPVLGDSYGRVLEDGEVKLEFSEGRFWVRYYSYVLPVAPQSYPRLLAAARDRLDEWNPAATEREDLNRIMLTWQRLTRRPAQTFASRQRRHRQIEAAKQELNRLCESSAALREAVARWLEQMNGVKGEPKTFDSLDRILAQQHYRLAHWRVAAEEINYRRFFDVNDLVALRMEDNIVFQASHQLLLQLLRAKAVSGIRIDHPDGLRDPAAHLWRLQKACFVETRLDELDGTLGKTRSLADARRRLGATFDAQRDSDPNSNELRPAWLVVEKILSQGESLRSDWPVHGTTGYEFMNSLNGIFVDGANQAALDRIYARFVGARQDYRDIANSAKKTVMLISFPGEINRLADRLKRIAVGDRHSRDFTLNTLAFAIREFIAALPVYRTYVDPGNGAMDSYDRAVIRQAIDEAKRRNPRTDPSLFEFLHDTMTLARPAADANLAAERLEFVARLQQTSGPVCAKGVEDTAFYIYNRLTSLNEVGGSPARFGGSVPAFHRANRQRLASWPSSLLATSTHDTKRSEDARARINVISELPREWRAALARWSRMNAACRSAVQGRAAPSRNDEYLLYQALLGIWPAGQMTPERHGEIEARVQEFMTKAIREAKVHTSWININAAYEAATSAFVRGILRLQDNPFLEDFAQLQRKVAYFGMLNSLSQTLLKLTAPGTPDIYQGNETWDFSLVDPDNRRAVDFELRDQMLGEVDSLIDSLPGLRRLGHSVLKSMEDGRIKLFLTTAGLRARRTWRAVFEEGKYVALTASDHARRHICAFARVLDGEVVVAVTPILPAGLMRGTPALPVGEGVWADAMLRMPGRLAGAYVNLLTGDRVETGSSSEGRGAVLRLSDVLSWFPVALLHKQT